MKVWFTADTHFGHGNILRYCNRPFMNPEESERAAVEPRGRWRVSEASVKRHDEALLDAINSAVGERDVLWILGDFCWGKMHEALDYRGRIRCKTVFLVWGNHDHRSIEPAFTDTYEQLMYSVENQDIWLNHYPSRSWNRRFHGAWHLYGHVHGKLGEEDAKNPSSLTKDVGVDACGYRPWSFEELKEYMSARFDLFERLKQQQLADPDAAGAVELG